MPCLWKQVLKACKHVTNNSKLWRKRLPVPARDVLQVVAAPRGEAGLAIRWCCKQPAKPNPLDPSVPIFVHPEVIDELGLHTLRLPPPAPPRTMDSFHASGELAVRFGCYQPTTAKGKIYVWPEVNPVLMEHGALRSEWDREFLQMRCRDILIEDGIISSDGSGFKDSHSNIWRFPTQRGDSSVNGK
jgi:hypothetical protein